MQVPDNVETLNNVSLVHLPLVRRRFVWAYVEGEGGHGAGVKAAEAAGYPPNRNSLYSRASENLRDPDVIAAIVSCSGQMIRRDSMVFVRALVRKALADDFGAIKEGLDRTQGILASQTQISATVEGDFSFRNSLDKARETKARLNAERANVTDAEFTEEPTPQERPVISLLSFMAYPDCQEQMIRADRFVDG